MRVLHISNYFYPHIGGIEQTSLDVMRALQNKDVIQKLICFNTNKQTIEEEILGFHIIRVGCFGKIASQSLSWKYYKALKNVITNFNPEVIHFHYPNPLVATFLLRIKFQGKLIIHWHLDITKQKILKHLFHHQNKTLLKRATKIICTSHRYLEGSSYLPNYREKVVVIPSIVNKEKISYTKEEVNKAERIKAQFPSKVICLAVGRQVEYKGTTFLIEAAKKLDGPQHFIIIGDGPLHKQLKEQALGLDNITFKTKVSESDLKAYYLAGDIFCFPSITKNEAFGLALCEAMYYKMPAVTFYIEGSGVNEINLNDITGLEVENSNVRMLALAIEALTVNQKRRKELGENAHQRIKNNFLMDSFQIELEELYGKIQDE